MKVMMDVKVKTPSLTENGAKILGAGQRMEKWTQLSSSWESECGFNHRTLKGFRIEGLIFL